MDHVDVAGAAPENQIVEADESLEQNVEDLEDEKT